MIITPLLGRSEASRRGFTMAEMIVAVTIMVIITALVAGLFTQVRKMVGLSQWMAETRTQIRATIETLAADLQNIDTDAWFIIYCSDERADPTNPTLPRLIWPDDPNSQYTRWADRMAFVAAQPSLSLQADAAIAMWPGASLEDFAASAARIYYGHPWRRPDLPWLEHSLVRRAIVHLSDPRLDPPAAERWLWDHESEMGVPNLYTYDDVRRVLAQAANTMVTFLTDRPEVDGASTMIPDPTQQRQITFGSRILLPSAYKVRFQVRLRDGTVWPRLLTEPEAALLRGGGSPVFAGDMFCLNTDDYGLTSPPVQAWVAWAGPVAYQQSSLSVPLPAGGQQEPWPAALRVRIEVYDPQRRTPDPIVVDQWLPIRWRRQP